MGGILKRTADRLVAHGRDLHNTDTVFTALEVETSVKLFKVSEQDVSNVDRCLPSGLKTVLGTMTFHQIVAICRKLRCFCCDATGDGKRCECCNPVAVIFPEPTSSPEQVVSQPAERVTMSGDMLTPVHVYSEDFHGKWCVVTYDGTPYPGIIEDADEAFMLVSIMHRIGENRYFHPTRKNAIWHAYDKIVTLIPEPSPVTSAKRHYQICPDIRMVICEFLDN